MPQPRVAVLGGTGQQGRGLAQRLALAGFRVIVGSRDEARAAAAVAAWPPEAQPATTAAYGSAIAGAEIIVLAVPFDSVHLLLDAHAHLFKPESLVVDVTVPVTVVAGTLTLADVAEGSAAEHVRARLPPHARVAATFKTVPAHLLGDTTRPLDCDEFVCGDSAESRSTAATLVEAMRGLRPIDVGPLIRARAIEQLTVLAIAINRRHKIHEARFRVIGM
jgi:8-hydroxy-5-deazaflavin:NADPH oxidoreductase